MNSLFRALIKSQPRGRILLAGCAKDGSGESPPPRTPPPPPPPPPPDGGTGGGDGGAGRRMMVYYRIAPHQHTFQVTFKDESAEHKITRDQEIQTAHLEHLDTLRASGVLQQAGAFASGSGGMLILLAASRKEAESIVYADPLIQKGFYKSFDIVEILPY